MSSADILSEINYKKSELKSITDKIKKIDDALEAGNKAFDSCTKISKADVMPSFNSAISCLYKNKGLKIEQFTERTKNIQDCIDNYFTNIANYTESISNAISELNKKKNEYNFKKSKLNTEIGNLKTQYRRALLREKSEREKNKN